MLFHVVSGLLVKVFDGHIMPFWWCGFCVRMVVVFVFVKERVF